MTSRRRSEPASAARTASRGARASSLVLSLLLRLLLLATLGFGLSACERGCASTWLSSKGSTGSGPPSGSTYLPLNAIDCPDGLARCVDGVVEVSRVFSYASPCVGPPDKCTCPWERVVACDRGCAADDVEIVLAREKAGAQLCAPAAAEVFARPHVVANEADGATPSFALARALCGGGAGADPEPYRCAAGNVVACATDGGDSAVIATCLRGCAEDPSYLEDDRLTRDQAVALLCRR